MEKSPCSESQENVESFQGCGHYSLLLEARKRRQRMEDWSNPNETGMVRSHRNGLAHSGHFTRITPPKPLEDPPRSHARIAGKAHPGHDRDTAAHRRHAKPRCS